MMGWLVAFMRRLLSGLPLDGFKTLVGLLVVFTVDLAKDIPPVVDLFGGNGLAVAAVIGKVIVVLGVIHRILKGGFF